MNAQIDEGAVAPQGMTVSATTVAPMESDSVPVAPEKIPDGLPPIVALVASGRFDEKQLETMLRLQREHDADQARRAYHEAMPRARAAMGPARRGRKNSHLGTSYASLDDLIEAARGPLSEHGFNYSWSIEQVEGKVRATCRMTHAAGHSESVVIEMPVMPGLRSRDGKQVVNDAQATGIAITYAKRYSFSALVGLATEDGDGDPRAVARQEAATPEPIDEPPMTAEQESGLVDLLAAIDELSDGFSRRWLGSLADKHPESDGPLGIELTGPQATGAHRQLLTRLEKAKTDTATEEAPE